MTKNNMRIRFFALFFAALSLFTMPVNALTQASDYIHFYSIDVYTSGQKIYTDFDVDASGLMTKVGAYEIKIYEYPYNSQNLVSSKNEYSTGMAGTNCYSYSNTITYTGQSNKKYKVIVTVFGG